MLAVAGPRFAVADPLFWSAWDDGVCWALPAPNYIPGTWYEVLLHVPRFSLEVSGLGGIWSAWDQVVK